MTMMLLLFLGALLVPLAAADQVDLPCWPCADGSVMDMHLEGSNCSSLSLHASSLVSNSEECRSLQMTAFEQCGCPTPPRPHLASRTLETPTCSICPDGYSVNEDVVVPMADVTCGFAQEVASRANQTTCDEFSVYAAWCGCPNVEPKCTLCPAGSLPPDLSLVIPELDITCGELAFIATTVSDVDECDEISSFSSICGCPAPETDRRCAVCPDRKPVPLPDLTLPNNATCAQVEMIASTAESSYQCNVLRSYASARCGCDDAELVNYPSTCTSLCSDGSPARFTERVIDVVDGQEVTCGTLDQQVHLGLAQGDRCRTYFYIGRSLCGCRDNLPPPPCTLCEDGSIPPQLFQAIDGTTTCGDFAALASAINDPTRCTALQGTAGVTCGCGNPIAAERACRLCPDDQLLPEPGRIAEADNELSCSEAEYVGTMAPDPRVCPGLQRNFRDICCETSRPSEIPNSVVAPSSSAPLFQVALESSLLPIISCGLLLFL